MAVYIGLDIGGTKLMVASADQTGAILRRARANTPLGLDEGLAVLNQMIADVSQGEPIAGMGAAIGGPLDWERGIVSPLHQPAWRDVPLKDTMQARWNSPFFVDVDTNIAALGDYAALTDPPARFVYLTLSTGMGGGFLIDGKIYRGMGGAHPEMGHQSIPYRCANPAALRCECGAPDCLEALVSGNGIRRIYGKPAEELAAQEWDEVTYNLGQGLRNIATLYTPDLISIGGGVAVGGGDGFIQQAARIMRAHLGLVPAPVVTLSHLGYDTALKGAINVAIWGL